MLNIFIFKKEKWPYTVLRALQYIGIALKSPLASRKKNDPFSTPHDLFKLPISRLLTTFKLSAYEMNCLSNRSVQRSYFSFPQCIGPELLASWLEFQ